LNRTEKSELVEKLHDELSKSGAVFITDYKGLTVEQVTQLRGGIRQAGGKYQVVKNTLLKLAAEGTNATGLNPLLEGPTAIAIAFDDPVALAKAIVEFSKKNENLEIQGGVLGSQFLTEEDVKDLAGMPSKEVLLARMLGSMNAPATNFVGVLAAMVRQLMYVLKAIEEKKSQIQE
jgi:large subunit ribosomal protein L10